MNLIIDIGNSGVNIAVTVSGEIVYEKRYDSIPIEVIDEILAEKNDIKGAIISTTRERDVQLEEHLIKRIPNAIIFNHETPIPLKNLYKTPETLGMDRLAAAVGAWSIMPGEELLVFDLGSAITIEHVTSKGEYMGGNISPGLRMRFRSLNHFTAKLPLVDYCDYQLTENYGTTTGEAIWCGVVRGIEYEIEGYIKKYPSAKLFFTGRDAKYFAKCTEKAIFADHLLVIRGLEQIIQYNAGNQKN